MKIAILGNQARAMGNFWTPLIRLLKASGHETLCCLPHPAPDDAPWEEALTALGARLIHYPLDRKGLNPARDLQTLLGLRAVLRAARPDVLFAFTIKPVIYGAFAAHLAGIPAKSRRHVMIPGLGYMFEADTPLKRLLRQIARILYRLALARVRTVFFQNPEDQTLFADLGITPPSVSVRLCRGTGVDLARFAPRPLPAGDPVFLYVGRLLEAKGLRELAAAARLLKRRLPAARLRLLGPEERGPGAVPLAEVLAWQQEGILEYLGSARDVRPHLAEASVVVLPSWREGLPTALLEAMAVGRPLIAANVPGCREVVLDGRNGLLVPPRNPEALAEAMQTILQDPARLQEMAAAGRNLVRTAFNAETVALDLMRHMDLERNLP
ncbi:MAG: glycosyltransferase family 4 protein [Desulfovibrio sp.]|jgi:glycosyltransferase involved in cell wall biosynthesis|nr:glycosyltransferase family 4 protein [Desulfovibrio sp.]